MEHSNKKVAAVVAAAVLLAASAVADAYCNGAGQCGEYGCCSKGGVCGDGLEQCCPNWCDFDCDRVSRPDCPSPEAYPNSFTNITTNYVAAGNVTAAAGYNSAGKVVAPGTS
ncbi:unnamed protein product [Linum trigynum]|uniref:Chitin-binding type-1 domain-containing protein n=1 Tax=Linum trigynum TaxID=586398 RepID=A0AAV2CND5_9ROSI